MNARKIAVTVPDDLVRKAEDEVTAGRARSLSAYVTEAVRERLQRDELADILKRMDEELGAPKRADTEWAARVVAKAKKRNRT